MELWLGLGSVAVNDLVDVAVACEEAGIAGVSMSDHLVRPGRLESSYPYTDDGSIVWEDDMPWPDSWVAIGAMAAVTSRLRFGTGVFVGPLREPIALAKAASTASVLSRGRVVCGLGAGWMKEEFDAVGEDFFSRGQRLDEITSILRQLWSGEMVAHSGAHYAFGPVQMLPAPPAPIPIWIGGNAPAAKRRAVLHDGWICAFHDPDQATADLQGINSLLDRAGRDGTFGTATVGPIRSPRVLRQLAEAGYGTVIVPLAMLTRSREIAGWLEAVRTAVRLAEDGGIDLGP